VESTRGGITPDGRHGSAAAHRPRLTTTHYANVTTTHYANVTTTHYANVTTTLRERRDDTPLSGESFGAFSLLILDDSRRSVCSRRRHSSGVGREERFGEVGRPPHEVFKFQGYVSARRTLHAN
jgi:hypothetical protein